MKKAVYSRFKASNRSFEVMLNSPLALVTWISWLLFSRSCFRHNIIVCTITLLVLPFPSPLLYHTHYVTSIFHKRNQNNLKINEIVFFIYLTFIHRTEKKKQSLTYKKNWKDENWKNETRKRKWISFSLGKGIPLYV